MNETPQEELVDFLSDMYAVEQQALAQLVSAPHMAQGPRLAADFRKHFAETKRQAEWIGGRLEAVGGSPSAIKDLVMKLGGKGFLLFARVQPETPGRLADHAYAYEAMEWAGYQMLMRFAERAGDEATAEVARRIAGEERAMMERLEEDFDEAEDVSHRDVRPQEMPKHVLKHLVEAHALESQGAALLRRGEKIAGNPQLQSAYAEIHAKLQDYRQSLDQRIEALGSHRSLFKDSVMGLGGLNWAIFFQAQSDTPAKLAAFVYAVLHLQIGGYELLKRTARRAGDLETKRLCETVIAEKRGLAKRLSNAFDSAADATLAFRGNEISRDSNSLIRDGARGALAGLAATVPMTAAMILLHRRLPSHERFEVPPEKVTRELAHSLDLESLTKGTGQTLATALAHLSYGAGAGSVYSVIMRRFPDNPIAGATYGLAVWAGSYLGLMPALGLHEPATRHPRRRNAMMAAAHVVWGTSLALLLRRKEGKGRASGRAENRSVVSSAARPVEAIQEQLF